MKARLYVRYPARSLVRGGQRTLLALFCVAVGVMAIVGLQLVGGMVKDALVGNARVLNGGDLSIRSFATPFTREDLAGPLDDLQRRGVVTAWTATLEDGAQVTPAGGKRALAQMKVVDPATYPLVGRPVLRQSTGGDFRSLLSEPGSAVVSRRLFETLGGEVGQTVRVNSGNDGRQFEARVVGVLEDDNAVAQGETILFSHETYRRASDRPFGFTAAYATAPDDARTDEAAEFIGERLPLARTETAPDLLRQLEEQVELINRFLVIVGLLALLIGGVGIVNTMQVLLARRKLEIAMLKTTGYQRRDLFLLFGLEAALLGLLGGLIGAALGIGVAALIRTLFERAFQLALTFSLDPRIIGGGVLVGLATALIFGLLPIVQAAGVRPQAVLRELPEGRSWRTVLGSIGLVLLLSLLFAALAVAIIGSVTWGLAAVYGAFAFLALLSLLFGLLVLVVGRLPVPERYSLPYLLLVTAGFAVSVAIAFVPDLRGIGILLALATGAGYVVVLLPREWKISTKMAFRNLGRARGRVTTTLLALFIGVFSVGLVLVLGQGVRTTINGFIAAQLSYNVLALVPEPRVEAFNRELDAAGDDVRRRQFNPVAIGTQPLAVNDQPIGALIERARQVEYDGPPVEVQINFLSGLQGYDLAAGQLPTVAEITAGRQLGAADAGTDNVIVDHYLSQVPFTFKPGDTITSLNQFTGQRRVLTIVGFYKASSTGISLNLNAAPVLGSAEAARALAGQTLQFVYYLQVDPDRAGTLSESLGETVPGALVFNLGDLLALFGDVLNNLLLMLTAIASLALIAGIIIIANAVALAMLERRRELGIMKAVGYTSGRVLGVTLIENGLIGGLGGLLGMLLVAVATYIFGRVSDVTLGVSAVTTLGLIALVVAVALLTATLVAWGAVRVRPLEVLRYE